MAVFTYSRVPAFNPNTTPVSVARSATGNVYDIGDTGFTTPLNLTLVATNTVTTTLVSDANGMFPDFTLIDRTSVVFKSGSGLPFVLTTTTPVPGPQGAASTVPGPPGPATTDASLLTAGTVADERLPVRLSPGELSATYAPKWVANTAYTAGQRVIAPSGFLVTAIGAVPSSATFDPVKWRYNLVPDLVQDFAAVGDGVADDTAAVNKAIAYALAATDPINVEQPAYTSNSGTIFAPIGAYSVNEIAIPGTVHILGQGGGTYAKTTFLQRTPGQSIFRLKADTDGSSNSTVFENIALKSVSGTVDNSVAQIITDQGITSHSVYFRNCWFKTPENYAIWLTQGDDIQIEGCTFDVAAFHSIRLGSATGVATNATVSNNTFYNVALKAVVLDNVRGLSIGLNRHYGGGANSTFIDIPQEGATTVRRVSVTGNEATSLKCFMRLSTLTENLAASGNVVDALTGSIVELTGGGIAYNISIVGNSFASTAAFSSGAAFAGPGCGLQNSIISLNTIIAGDTTALMFDMSDTRVTGNQMGSNKTLRFTADNNFASLPANGITPTVPVAKTASYTLTVNDGPILANGATLTMTLPDPTTVASGQRFTVKNINASAVTVNSAGTAKTLDGAASQSLAQWATARYISDGSQWLAV